MPSENTPKQFRLPPATVKELDEIARHLTAEMGTEQTRTDAICYAARQTHKRMAEEKAEGKPRGKK
jgi:hypothetical protein